MRIFLAIIVPAFLLAACSGGNDERSQTAPMVKASPVATHRFVERIEAIGTALANEQVTLAAPVTERLVRINFQDGGFVHAGQVLAVLARDQESAQLRNAQAQSREAEQQLSRLQALKQRGFATNAAVDTQVALAAAASAQAAEANASIGDRVIRAPFSGYASLRTISQGAVVTSGTDIATISDLSRIKLDFPVPETLLASIRLGQIVDATPAAYPGRVFQGRISSIDPIVNPATRAAMVRALLPNPGRLLKPGMLLTVGVRSSERISPAVPELAVVGAGDERFVYVLGTQDKVKRVRVRTGARQDGVVEVVDGLKAGDRIIVEGVVKLSDGMKVQTGASKPPAGM